MRLRGYMLGTFSKKRANCRFKEHFNSFIHRMDSL